jgi:2-dehydro-3-deoxygluconokinase
MKLGQDQLCAALGGMVQYLKFSSGPDGKLANYGISGGEGNFAIAVANAGRRTVMATAIVEGHPFTERVLRHLSRVGPTGATLLDVEPKLFSYDGVTGHNYAHVFYALGDGPAGDSAFYQRGRENHEAAAALKPGDFDWKGLTDRGVRWLHSGGIFSVLGPDNHGLVVEGFKAVQAASGITSFDLNCRPKLSNVTVGGRHQEFFAAIVPHVTMLIGNEEDLQVGLGIQGPSVAKKGDKFDPDHFKPMAEEVVRRFPGVKVVATSVRNVKRRDLHEWGACMWFEGQLITVPPEEIVVVDRVGGGDAFAGSLAAALMAGIEPEMALKIGVAGGAACAAVWGDCITTPWDAVVKAAGGSAARIVR